MNDRLSKDKSYSIYFNRISMSESSSAVTWFADGDEQLSNFEDLNVRAYAMDFWRHFLGRPIVTKLYLKITGFSMFGSRKCILYPNLGLNCDVNILKKFRSQFGHCPNWRCLGRLHHKSCRTIFLMIIQILRSTTQRWRFAGPLNYPYQARSQISRFFVRTLSVEFLSRITLGYLRRAGWTISKYILGHEWQSNPQRRLTSIICCRLSPLPMVLSVPTRVISVA